MLEGIKLAVSLSHGDWIIDFRCCKFNFRSHGCFSSFFILFLYFGHFLLSYIYIFSDFLFQVSLCGFFLDNACLTVLLQVWFMGEFSHIFSAFDEVGVLWFIVIFLKL